MDTGGFDIRRDRVSLLRKVDIFGKPEIHNTSFDHRAEAEPVGIYLSQLRIGSICLWFLRTDNQNVALQGMATSYRRLNENNFFDPYEDLAHNLKKSEQDFDIVHFDDGEYIKGINVTIADSNNKIGALEFVTSKKGRKVKAYGSPNQTDLPPPGQTKTFSFGKGDSDSFPGYVVGFYGQMDDNYITHLGVYIAPYTEINYYIRRGYILTYKKMQQDKHLIEKIAKQLGVDKDGERFKDIAIEGGRGHTSKLLLYFLEASLLHPELFKNVLEYL